ncbi:MAG: DNA-binding transcriptional ArsR family regulator [Yoonia sp.]|jgi:DNA-binding transcriptional ArsR family regulator
MPNPEQMGFRALADPTRRDILQMLAKRDMTIVEVAENFQMTRAAVKKHLLILNEGGLINVRSDGRTKVNTLDVNGMKKVFSWFDYFDTFWDDRLSKLKTEIEKEAQ